MNKTMNNMLRVVLTAALIIVVSATEAKAEVCDCTGLLDQVVTKLEANYIGARHLDEQGQQDYAQHKQLFSQKVKSKTGVECVSLLAEFVGFFEDRHLSVFHAPDRSDVVKQQIKGDVKEPVEIAAILNRQKAAGVDDPNDKIIGTYTDGQTEFAIIREQDKYNAYVLSTTREGLLAGELKATVSAAARGYTGTYYTYGYAARYSKANLYKQSTLLKIGGTGWLKTDGDNQALINAVDMSKGIAQPSIRRVDDQTVLITITSFSIDYKLLAEEIKQHKDLLLESANLIFDIRGNTGGNAIYFPLFPYFSDQQMPGGQGHVLASADNLAYFERNLQYSKKIYKPVVEAISEHMGQIVDGPVYPGRNYKRKKGSKVQNVAILTDEACMSAAESFIIHARGSSSLVKTYGKPTAGVIDYTSVNSLKLNCDADNVYFGYPTGTLNKDIPDNGYNATGIVPDVPIGEEVKDPIGFIVEHLRKDK